MGSGTPDNVKEILINQYFLNRRSQKSALEGHFVPADFAKETLNQRFLK